MNAIILVWEVDSVPRGTVWGLQGVDVDVEHVVACLVATGLLQIAAVSSWMGSLGNPLQGSLQCRRHGHGLDLSRFVENPVGPPVRCACAGESGLLIGVGPI